MNNPDTMVSWAADVVESSISAGINMQKAHLAEVGPGHSLGVAAALLLAGAIEVVALDVNKFADPNDTEALRPVADLWQERNGHLTNSTSLEQCLGNLRYEVVDDRGNWPLADDSMDVIYSFFSGEHLKDPGLVLDQTLSALRPGGLCVHAIDLRNHLDWGGNWLQHYYYEDWLWEAMTSRRGHWTNRLLSPQWRALFEERFDVLEFEEGSKPAPENFDRTRLATPFVSYDQAILEVNYIWVVARKHL